MGEHAVAESKDADDVDHCLRNGCAADVVTGVPLSHLLGSVIFTKYFFPLPALVAFGVFAS